MIRFSHEANSWVICSKHYKQINPQRAWLPVPVDIARDYFDMGYELVD